MSGDQRRPEAPKGPPWSLDVLADYHAGVLDEDTAREVRRTIESDDEAQATLAALTATTNDLAALAPVPIPDDVAAKVESALAEQAQERTNAWAGTSSTDDSSQPHVADAGPGTAGRPSNVIDIRTRRRRRASWGALLVASAAVISTVIAAPLIMNSTEDTQSAQPAESNQPTESNQPPPDTAPHNEHPPSPTPLALSGAGGEVTLTQQQLGDALKSEQYAESLRQPEQLLACLQANGIDNGRPLGAREVTVDGQPAQLFILSGGEIGQFRLLTVGLQCGANNPETISNATFGG